MFGEADEKEAFGPIFDRYRIEDGKMAFHFAHGAGLHCTEEQVTGFELAGEDQQYYEAEAKICGEEVVASCEKVSQPMYGRFCWTNYRPVTLFGGNGIPVAPFRTSRWDGAIATGSRNGWEF